jgi:hypothetical protein
MNRVRALQQAQFLPAFYGFQPGMDIQLGVDVFSVGAGDRAERQRHRGQAVP